ncbi:hypothetical protein JCM9140_4639 [Halalkalibacter wakoensis JCM 9140]|uniref:DUF4956 domain-containing protein n=1 Tax=Halalkalibacter wakoensis JCM 9140 TaxID=1236970 RepID=W4Q8W1_9BACI|nr:DUF4956 domain-containing protein [Halalkalibacter wakoensis]GAE28415.1 hypothetical protein JCM9140_4639 [Halalkalibacter wakoensis JCM 9140]
MSQLFEELQFFADHTTRAAVIESFAAIILSFLLSLLITWVYRITHKKGQYSQSFIHTIIIMSVVVSVIMIVIGNNIAVAFGLVGAFSIIRFRSAMSDPKDIAFIFFGMAAGIACGLGFYTLAVLFAVTLSILIYILFAVDYGRKDEDEKTLKVTIPENLHYEDVFDELFDQYLQDYKLLQVETTSLGTMYQLTYTITLKEGITDKVVMDAIREHNANLKVSIIMPSKTY